MTLDFNISICHLIISGLRSKNYYFLTLHFAKEPFHFTSLIFDLFPNSDIEVKKCLLCNMILYNIIICIIQCGELNFGTSSNKYSKYTYRAKFNLPQWYYISYNIMICTNMYQLQFNIYMKATQFMKLYNNSVFSS